MTKRDPSYKVIGLLKSGVDPLKFRQLSDSTKNNTYKTLDIKKASTFLLRLLKSGVDLLSHPQKGSTREYASIRRRASDPQIRRMRGTAADE